MTRRVVAVLVPAPGAVPEHLRLAMAEDVYETVAALELVEPAVVLLAGDPAESEVVAMTWPGTPVRVLAARVAARSPAGAALRMLATGADQVTVVAGDAPDLPGLLLGKLHRALGSAEVAVLPSEAGGLLAVAARCPVAGWLPGDEALDLDDPDAVMRLQAVAPHRAALSVGPGWHRVRSVADLAALDPGLEGWEVTRAALRR